MLAELIALCNARGIDRRIAIEFVGELANDPYVTVAWVEQDIHRSAMELLKARPDKVYSLCDAVSFVLMRRHGMSEALATDKHFEQEGFMRLLAI